MTAKKHLLDSNIVTYIYQKSSSLHSLVSEKLLELSHRDRVFVSILSLYEYEYGLSFADCKIVDELQESKKTLLEIFEIMPLSVKGAEIFGKIKARYRQATGMSQKALERHNIDIMLAASAVSENAVLVSNDRIFERIQEIYPDLSIDNWTVS